MDGKAERIHYRFDHRVKCFGCDKGVGRIMTTACAMATVFLLVGAMVTLLYAQTYPNKPIRLILPFQPGGTTDIIGRIIGQKLAERLGQPVVPDNRPGAGSNIGITNAVPQIQAGKVRALAVLSNVRLPSLPDVPTAKEAGIENYEVTSWYGLLAPAGTPRDIVNRLNAEWGRIAAEVDTKEKMQNAGFETISVTPEQFSEFIRKDIVRWGKVIKDANLSIE